MNGAESKVMRNVIFMHLTGAVPCRMYKVQNPKWCWQIHFSPKVLKGDFGSTYVVSLEENGDKKPDDNDYKEITSEEARKEILAIEEEFRKEDERKDNN